MRTTWKPFTFLLALIATTLIGCTSKVHIEYQPRSLPPILFEDSPNISLYVPNFEDERPNKGSSIYQGCMLGMFEEDTPATQIAHLAIIKELDRLKITQTDKPFDASGYLHGTLKSFIIYAPFPLEYNRCSGKIAIDLKLFGKDKKQPLWQGTLQSISEVGGIGIDFENSIGQLGKDPNFKNALLQLVK
tara:strand:+ start:461 stop:1027 length:567 start_codon:yes stop_codon:yes gene_type:complete